MFLLYNSKLRLKLIFISAMFILASDNLVTSNYELLDHDIDHIYMFTQSLCVGTILIMNRNLKISFTQNTFDCYSDVLSFLS